MHNTLWNTLANIPWWVYMVYFLLLRISFEVTKPRIIGFKQVFILPPVFLGLTIITLSYYIDLTPFNLALWFGAAVFGVVAGYLHFRFLKVKAIPGEAKLYFPGTWTLLLLVLLVSYLKYHYNFSVLIYKDDLANPAYAQKVIGLLGLCSGLFIGRLAYSLRCRKIGPFYRTVA